MATAEEDTPPPRYEEIFPQGSPSQGASLSPTLSPFGSPRRATPTGSPVRTHQTRGSAPQTVAPPLGLTLVKEVKVKDRIRGVLIGQEPETPRIYLLTDAKPTVTVYDVTGRALAAYGTGSSSMMFAPDPEYDLDMCMCVAEGGTIARTSLDGVPLASHYSRHLPVDGDHDLVSMAALVKEDSVRYVAVDVTSGSIIKIEPAEGEVRRKFKVAKGDQFAARHVAGHPALKDTIAVSGLHSNQIRLYSRRGDVEDIIGCYGYGDDELKDPAGLCVDSRRRILVCDHGNGRVVRFSRVARGRWEGRCVVTMDMLNDRRPNHIAVSDAGYILLSVQSKFGENSWLLFTNYDS